MKKSFSLIIALLLISGLFAQVPKRPNRIFKKGQGDVYATFGLIPTFFADNAAQKLPPINVGADFMLSDHFSLGGMVGYSISETGMKEFSGGENGNLRNNYLEVALKMGLHITRIDNMSIYGGFLLSYHRSDVNATEGDLKQIGYHSGIQSNQQKIIPGGYVGYKYAFTKNFTAMAELGYGVSIFRIGVGYRLL